MSQKAIGRVLSLNNKLSRVTEAFLLHEKALKSFLSRYLARQQDIEDIVQDTFLKAYNAEKKTEIQSPKAFLFKVAKNAALKELTKKSTQITDYIEDSSSSEIIDHITAIDDQVYAQNKLRLFRKAAASLPMQCRRVFLMRKVYGFSHKEIARQLGLSVSTVEKHVANGLQRCRDYMRCQGYEVGSGKKNVKQDKGNDPQVDELSKLRKIQHRVSGK